MWQQSHASSFMVALSWALNAVSCCFGSISLSQTHFRLLLQGFWRWKGLEHLVRAWIWTVRCYSRLAGCPLALERMATPRTTPPSSCDPAVVKCKATMLRQPRTPDTGLCQRSYKKRRCSRTRLQWRVTSLFKSLLDCLCWMTSQFD